MSIIIDRRLNGRGKSTENRKKFLKRVRATIKEQLPDLIRDRNVTDMGGAGGKIKIPDKTINEPTFRPGPGGNHDMVWPGNEDFVPGDAIGKPRSSKGGSGKQGGRGKSEDDFIINISREEFLDFLFEDLELPDLVKKELSKVHETIRRHAGFKTDGPPNQLSVVRSYRQSMLRRLPIKSSLEAKIALLEQAKSAAEAVGGAVQAVSMQLGHDRELFIPADMPWLECEPLFIDAIEHLRSRRNKVPFLDPIDLRYKQTLIENVPTTHATMIMIMDNSGSMGLKEKTIAKKFFFLLYAFLQRQYQHVDLVFISHTEDAREMDEEEFFNTHESGGTIVSSALEVTRDIIRERLSGRTNVYVSQVSDGDNMSNDNEICKDLLLDAILPETQYYAYIQVDDYHDETPFQQTLSSFVQQYEKGLWKTYTEVSEMRDNFQMARVCEDRDIYPVFKKLFEKKN